MPTQTFLLPAVVVLHFILFFVPPATGDESSPFGDLIDSITTEKTKDDSADEAEALLEAGKLDEAVQFLLDLDKKNRDLYLQLPYNAPPNSDSGSQSFFESKSNKTLRYLLYRKLPVETKALLLSRLFNEDHPDHGFYLRSSFLRNLGEQLEESLESESITPLRTRISKIKEAWLEIDPEAQDIVAYSVGLRLCDDWEWRNHQPTDHRWMLRESLEIDFPRFYEPLLAGVEAMQSIFADRRDQISTFHRPEIRNPSHLLAAITNEDIPLPIRATAGLRFCKGTSSFFIESDLPETAFSLFLQSISSGYHSPFNYDLHWCFSELRDAGLPYSFFFPEEGEDQSLSILTWLERVTKGGDYYPAQELSGEALSRLLNICHSSHQPKTASEIAQKFTTQDHKRDPRVILSLIEAGEFDLARPLLPEVGEPMKGYNLCPTRPKLVKNGEVFFSSVDPAIRVDLETMTLVDPRVPGAPNLSAKANQEHAEKLIPLLPELSRFPPLEARRTLKNFSRFPELLPELTPFIEQYAPDYSLAEKYEGNEARSYPITHQFFHGLRLAAAYTQRDWQEAHRLLEEIYSIKDAHAYDSSIYLREALSILTPHFYRDLNHASEEELKGIRNFWETALKRFTLAKAPRQEVDNRLFLSYTRLAYAASGTPLVRKQWLKKLPKKKFRLLHSDSSWRVSPNLTLFRKLFAGDVRFQNSLTGPTARLEVVREHLANRAFLKLDKEKSFSRHEWHGHALRNEQIFELVSEPETSWATSAYFLSTTAWFAQSFSKTERESWMTIVTKLLTQKPDRPQDSYDAFLWDSLQTARMLNSAMEEDFDTVTDLIQQFPPKNTHHELEFRINYLRNLIEKNKKDE